MNQGPPKHGASVAMAPVRFATYRLRALVRIGFLLLILAAIVTAWGMLAWLRKTSFENYQQSMKDRLAQIQQRMNLQSGQLGLLNGAMQTLGKDGRIHPYLLPYDSIDVNSTSQAWSSIDQTQCWIDYGDKGRICASVAGSRRIGAYVFVAGKFDKKFLRVHEPRSLVDGSTFIEISTSGLDDQQTWKVVFEAPPSPSKPPLARVRGAPKAGAQVKPALKAFQMTAFREGLRLERDFAGTAMVNDENECEYVLRVPIRSWQALPSEGVWPPKTFRNLTIDMKIVAPESGVVIDSSVHKGLRTHSWSSLATSLRPGEAIKADLAATDPLVLAASSPVLLDPILQMLDYLTALPERASSKWNQTTQVSVRKTPYTLTLTGDRSNVDVPLASVVRATAAVLPLVVAATLLLWLAVEWAILRRVTVMKRRAEEISESLHSGGALERKFESLRGADELGVLAAGLDELTARVNETVTKEAQRLIREREQWQEIGHEVRGPLIGLATIARSRADIEITRYVQRMQQAFDILVGSASLIEAMADTTVERQPFDIAEFLQQLAKNCALENIDNVRYNGAETPVIVLGDSFALEAATSNVLSNATRYRPAGTPIVIHLDVSDKCASFSISNQGPHIEPDMLEKIFDYGISAHDDEANRGQGLYIARINMLKMGGMIWAQNLVDGVAFCFELPLVPQSAES